METDKIQEFAPKREATLNVFQRGFPGKNTETRLTAPQA
jgi:hypothetical protein